MSRICLFAATLFLLLAGCHKQSGMEPDTQSSGRSPVEVTTAHLQNVTDTLTIPARVAADPTRVVHVFSQVSGRLAELYVRPGQEVMKGQTLGMIQSSEVSQARSDYEKAKIEALRADRQLDRAKLLLQHEVLAQKDYDDLQAASQAAHAEMSRAEQRVHMLGFSVEGVADTTSLKSPITGAVLDIGTASGEMQRSLDNAASIATIANLDEVWVLGDVYERDLGTVHTGQAVDISFSAYPAETVRGTISNLSDAIDPASLTLKARVVLKNPGHRYKPLMYATIAVERSKERAFVLPATAIIHEGSQSYIFVQISPGNYDKRQVVTSQIQGTTVEVKSGIKDGEQIVTTGAALLRAPAGD
jgi:cobalt-zinc-cadmium efflux system membrane fusion protein